MIQTRGFSSCETCVVPLSVGSQLHEERDVFGELFESVSIKKLCSMNLYTL